MRTICGANFSSGGGRFTCYLIKGKQWDLLTCEASAEDMKSVNILKDWGWMSIELDEVEDARFGAPRCSGASTSPSGAAAK